MGSDAMFSINVKSYCLLFLLFWPVARPCHAQDVKVCPDEPIPPASAPCPARCNRGCENGICQVYNPFDPLVILPDTMRSLVICEGFSYLNGSRSCSGIIKCSERSSCDILVTSGAGNLLGVNCGNTTQSCNVFCDAADIYDMRCNATSACNCQTNCALSNTKCRPGFTCLGDLCYRNLLPACRKGVSIDTLDVVLNSTGPCDCTCKNASLSRLTFGDSYYCLDPNSICTSNADCNFPFGACDRTCKCANPWGGRNCTTHMCPQCENSAFCGNSTQMPCICTGLWTGENCTVPLQLTPSRLDISEQVDRCNSTSLVPWSAPPPQDQISISCPAPCSRCSTDSDGTPVCLIMLPIAGQLTTIANCPTTHRCIGLATRNGFGYFTCSGPYACDFACADNYCSYASKCSSDVSCRIHCGNLLQADPLLATSIDFSCQRPNGSCLCDTGNCPYVTNCVPGSSCNGDRCSSLQCSRGKRPVLNNDTNQCQCVCYPHLYALPDGSCISMNHSRNCESPCQNGGICKDAKCWCPPGYSGSDCSQRDSCVSLNTTASCPSACDWCNGGICFYSLRTLSPSILAVCPVGFPCVFICEAEDCKPTNNQVVCPAGSGPCELWCWDSISDNYGTWFYAPRPSSGCTKVQMICEDGTIGCRARCNSIPGLPDTAYYGARTVRALHCGSTNVTTRSETSLDRCASCGTDSCFIAEDDPCYKQAINTNSLRQYGYLPLCPTDRLGVHLDIRVNSSNQCECACPKDMLFVNQTCVAMGCDPPCQNFGVCEVLDLPGTANDTFRCRCFGGWNGPDCTSRCFFPVNASVTLCLNGLYRISGQLQIPENRNLSLYGEVPDLVKLEVEGDVSFGGKNTTLSISLPSNWNNSMPVVNVGGNWTQTNGSTLQNGVIYDPKTGHFITTLVNANGTVSFGGGILELQLSGTDLINWIMSHAGQNISIIMFTYGSLDSRFGHVVLNDVAPANRCEQLVSSPTYSGTADTSRRMEMVFSLDTSSCATPQVVSDAASANVAAIIVGLSVACVALAAAAGGVWWKRHKLAVAYAQMRQKMLNRDILETTATTQMAATPPQPLKWAKTAPSSN